MNNFTFTVSVKELTDSEQVDSRQLSLFNDAEKNSDIKIDEPSIEEITYTRKER